MLSAMEKRRNCQLRCIHCCERAVSAQTRRVKLNVYRLLAVQDDRSMECDALSIDPSRLQNILVSVSSLGDFRAKTELVQTKPASLWGVKEKRGSSP